MSDSQPILTVQDVRITFGGLQPFTAVQHISFTIGRGKTLAIVGESGSGKSLTALSLMGLLPNTAMLQGAIFLNDGDTYSLHQFKSTDDWRQVRGHKAGMIFQEPMSALNPVLKVGSQLAEAILAGHDVTLGEANKLAMAWLGKVQLPTPEALYHRYPHQLSGGQKQRVMIAIAMCNDPVLLIADEPTTALDVTVQAGIIQLMKGLQQEHNTAMIFITHDLALASTLADDVLVMYKGEIVEYGNTAQVLHAPKHPYTAALLACRPTAQQKNKKLPVVEDFLNAKTPAIITTQSQPAIQITATPLLQVKDLRVWFVGRKSLGKPVSHFKAVDDLSFTLHKGEVLGLVGESGCGKSTLSRALIGLLPVHNGSINYNGAELANATPGTWNIARRDIQMIFQDPYASLNPRLTIGDAIMEPMRVHNIVPVKELQKELLRLLSLVHLPADAAHRYPHQFSGGQRQRIGIARALALRPKILICDESVSALDVSVQAQILNLLKELQYEFQLTYLFISHDLGVVYYISDRVMVMQAGKIVESGTAQQVLQHPSNNYTKKLVGAMPGLV